MFALKQIWKYACVNVQRPGLIAKSLSYFEPVKTTVGVNTSFNFGRNSLCPTTIGSLNLRPSLLTVNIPNEMDQRRSVTQYSMSKGKRRTVHVVLHKFYRLDWGIWIRTRCGRHKKLYKKSSALKRRLKQHVFCNAQQSTLLDKMVSKFYRRPKYFVDDPYEPYHKREEFAFARKTPIKSELL